MPGKKKKYNARFPPARIKKIMQTDEEVGKVAQAVPVIISRALELFAENLLDQANKVTLRRGARTLTPSHLKFCIENERKFDFLRDMVTNVPDLQDDDLEMEGDVIPIEPASKPRPKPLTTNGKPEGIENVFKEPQSRESTPGSPFPSPLSTTPLTPTSIRGGPTSKRRGRPPKQNGSLGRSFPPMPGHKRRLSEDSVPGQGLNNTSCIDLTDGAPEKSVFGSELSPSRPLVIKCNSKFNTSDSSSLPASPLALRVNSTGSNGEHQYQLSSKLNMTSPPSSSYSGGGREGESGYNHHHTTWAAKKKMAGLARSNSTPTGRQTFSYHLCSLPISSYGQKN
jgi:histone H3/H4